MDNINFEDYLGVSGLLLPKEAVLKNDSVDKTAEDITKKLTPKVQLVLMTLSDDDIDDLNINNDNNCQSFVNNYLFDDIDEQINDDSIWCTKDEYTSKWNEEYEEKLEELEDTKEDAVRVIDEQYDLDKEDLVDEELVVTVVEKLDVVVKEEVKSIVDNRKSSKQVVKEVGVSKK